jgi:hypothetical protein
VNSSGQQGSLTVGNGSGQVVLNASY